MSHHKPLLGTAALWVVLSACSSDPTSPLGAPGNASNGGGVSNQGGSTSQGGSNTPLAGANAGGAGGAAGGASAAGAGGATAAGAGGATAAGAGGATAAGAGGATAAGAGGASTVNHADIAGGAPPVEGTLVAFPGAEGYGKYTKGGRGGAVYEVTNLNDSGEGSLRAAVLATGPRTVVFRVSGTIQLMSDLDILSPNITIAGQTAPGDGIALRGYPLMIRAGEVIIRYIRVRFGDEALKDADAVSGRYQKNIIIDHVSASWSIDETMSIYHSKGVTVQWSIISESLFASKVTEKGPHGFGAIWGANYSSYHHNLIAHHSSRTVRFASGCGNTDYRNNVIYNWGYNSAYGGEKQQEKPLEYNFSNINMVANYYKPGPATKTDAVGSRIVDPSSRGAGDFGSWYVADNFFFGNAAVTADNMKGVHTMPTLLDKAWPAMPITQHTAEAAYELVLNQAGATLPKRDSVDARIVAETRAGNATFEGPAYKAKWTAHLADPSAKTGIIDSQTDVGGWPELASTPAPADTDHDGMPDAWETTMKLDPANPNDRNNLAEDGYTMLEKYLNSIQ